MNPKAELTERILRLEAEQKKETSAWLVGGIGGFVGSIICFAVALLAFNDSRSWSPNPSSGLIVALFLIMALVVGFGGGIVGRRAKARKDRLQEQIIKAKSELATL